MKKKLTFLLISGIMTLSIFYFTSYSSNGSSGGKFELEVCTMHDSNGNIIQIGNTFTTGRTNCVPNRCGGGPQT